MSPCASFSIVRPCSRIAARCDPRATKLTSQPARASRPPKKPPTPPEPIITIFICIAPLVERTDMLKRKRRRSAVGCHCNPVLRGLEGRARELVRVALEPLADAVRVAHAREAAPRVEQHDDDGAVGDDG